MKSNVPNTVAQIVKGNKAIYLYCVGSELFYEINTGEYKYEFPIDVSSKEEVGNATFNRTEKAIFLMRYINKAIKNNKLKWSKV